MNKNTKTAIAVGVVGVAAYLLYKQSQKKSFANLTQYPVGCKLYSGTVNAAVGTILSSWVDGGGKRGIIVSKTKNSFVVCPENQEGGFVVPPTGVKQSTISR